MHAAERNRASQPRADPSHDPQEVLLISTKETVLQRLRAMNGTGVQILLVMIDNASVMLRIMWG